jgi:hypothetical protein
MTPLFIIGCSILVGTWIAAKRWSVVHDHRYGRMPARGWLFRRVDDESLERGRRTLLVFLGIVGAVAIAIIAQAIRT